MPNSVVNILFFVVGVMFMAAIFKSTGVTMKVGSSEYLCYVLQNPFK